MAAPPLTGPPATLSTDNTLPVTMIEPASLVRLSLFPDGEPYFGRRGVNRFDAPGCRHGAPEYGACYVGLSLDVALAETVLHDETAVNGNFRIALDLLRHRYVHRFQGERLRMLNLVGATLKRQAGHADLAGSGNYDITQLWALAIHCNPLMFDGFCYMSRHSNDGRAAVLFDRVGSRLAAVRPSTPLLSLPEFVAMAQRYGIVAV